jgi:hypothetical protein
MAYLHYLTLGCQCFFGGRTNFLLLWYSGGATRRNSSEDCRALKYVADAGRQLLHRLLLVMSLQRINAKGLEREALERIYQAGL